MEGVFIMAQSSTHVSTASDTTALPHPAWCTTEHRNTAPTLHQSVELVLGAVAGMPVTAQRVQIDPEASRTEQLNELWVAFGSHYIEVPLAEAADMAKQLRNVAASIELLLGGA